MITMFKILGLTVSDTCYKDNSQDQSRLAMLDVLKNIFGQKFEFCHQFCPDDAHLIQKSILSYVKLEYNMIITSGGTGLSLRDVTPETCQRLFTKDLPGMALLMMTESLKITPLASLSRLCCGLIDRTLVINLPGSPKGLRENLVALKCVLPHALEILTDTNQESTRHLHSNGSTTSSVPVEKSHCFSVFETNKNGGKERHSKYPKVSEDQALSLISEQINYYSLNCKNPSYKSYETKQLKQLIEEDSNKHCNILGEDVHSPINIPKYPTSTKDGYAINLSELTPDRFGNTFKIVYNEIKDYSYAICERDSQNIAYKLYTGSVVPDHFDTVIQLEDTRIVEFDAVIKIELGIQINTKALQSAHKGQNIRLTGSDIAQHQLVCPKLTLLQPCHIGLFSMIGCCESKCIIKPKIAIFSTGDEVLESSEENLKYPTLKKGQVWDSNGPMLYSLFSKHGFECQSFGIIRDTTTALHEMFHTITSGNRNKNGSLKTENWQPYNVIVTTGGVSMGDKDYIKDVILEMGGTIHFGRVDLKPGMPTTYSTFETTKNTVFHIFSLPGNPVSAYVMSLIFILPALAQLCGLPDPKRNAFIKRAKAKLTHDILLDDNRPEYARGKTTGHHPITGHLCVQLLSQTINQMSSNLMSLADADCLVYCPKKAHDKQLLYTNEIVDIIYL